MCTSGTNSVEFSNTENGGPIFSGGYYISITYDIFILIFMNLSYDKLIFNDIMDKLCIHSYSNSDFNFYN